MSEFYDKARRAGASHEEAMKASRLAEDGMLFVNGGLHAEKAGLPYAIWDRLRSERG